MSVTTSANLYPIKAICRKSLDRVQDEPVQLWYRHRKRRIYMFEKFKEKCKSISRNRAAVITVVCLLMAVAVVISVSVATNRAKKKYGNEDSTSGGGQVTEDNRNDVQNGTLNAPTHDNTESLPVSGEIEEFELSLPVSGTIAKGHDSTIQVWSETMGDYRVHLGVDIESAEGAPVCAAADGTVSKIWDDALMGRCVAISHDGDIYTFYKNLDTTLSSGIKEGTKVKCGQEIGCVGDTALAELADEPHLHIEMTVKGLAVDPRDYFSKEATETLAGTANTDGEGAGK